MLAIVNIDWKWAPKPAGLRYGCLLVIEYAPHYAGELNPRASRWIDCGVNADKSELRALYAPDTVSMGKAGNQ